jgi:hypothetical protein
MATQKFCAATNLKSSVIRRIVLLSTTIHAQADVIETPRVFKFFSYATEGHGFSP